jgi:hypothetical protein
MESYAIIDGNASQTLPYFANTGTVTFFFCATGITENILSSFIERMMTQHQYLGF